MPASKTMRFLRILLLWEGKLSRSRVMEVFGLKQTRASESIRAFCEAHPGWTKLNTLTKSHEATPKAWIEGSAGKSPHEKAAMLTDYLAISSAPLASHVEREDGIIWSAFPELTVPEPADFAAVHRAIAQGQALEIIYRSLTNPEPHRRTIRPHSIINAGRRWHVRAYCDKARAFRDFTFGRMDEIRISKADLSPSAADDRLWNTRVKIELIAHPGLSQAQQRLVRDEYFGGSAAFVANCRACLVPYYIRELDAAIDLEKEPAPKYLLAVGNAEEVSKWMLP